MPQRDHHDIVKDILKIVYTTQPLFRTLRSQTSIGHGAKLTHPQTVKYLENLVGIRLLILTDFKPYPFYELTKKGYRCLQLFSEIEDDLRPVARE
jgi:predicted transcriptional regulator